LQLKQTSPIFGGDTDVGFGIAGAVFAVGAFLTPIGFNLVASWIALVSAALAVASRRGVALAAVTWIVCAINLFLLNSETRAVLLGWLPGGTANVQIATTSLYLTIASFGAPILAAVFSRALRTFTVKTDQAVLAPAPSLALAPDIAEADGLRIQAAPVRGEAELPPPRLRSKTARLLLLFATVIGAAAVVIFLRSLDAPSPAPGQGVSVQGAAAIAI
jgi:hypothetical protein